MHKKIELTAENCEIISKAYDTGYMKGILDMLHDMKRDKKRKKNA